MSGGDENLSPPVIQAVLRELKDLMEKPCEGIQVIVNEENVGDVQADMLGPEGTPYEGGSFRIRLLLGNEFPRAPPKGYFLTKIFHPNVSKLGEICVNTLKKDWLPTHNLRHVLVVIRCLLIEPNPESALNEEAGKLLLEDYDSYAQHARLMTGIHAQRRGGAGEGTSAGVAGGEGGEGPASPTLKKAKSLDAEKKTLERKKSLKRL